MAQIIKCYVKGIKRAYLQKQKQNMPKNIKTEKVYESFTKLSFSFSTFLKLFKTLIFNLTPKNPFDCHFLRPIINMLLGIRTYISSATAKIRVWWIGGRYCARISIDPSEMLQGILKMQRTFLSSLPVQ